MNRSSIAGMERSARRLVPAVVAAVVTMAGCAGQSSAPEPAASGPLPAPVAAAEYERHLATLASDEFEGRKPATEGERRTLAYLEQEFRRIGLRPGNGESYLQHVPIVEITTSSGAVLDLDTPQGRRSLAYADDMVVWTKRVVAEIDLQKSPLVFVGHGVVAPEYGWNDYAGVDMRGKTAVILINDPGFAVNDPDLFRGRALTYYGRWTYKFEEAARQGAAGALIIHETEPAAYPWQTVTTSWTGPQLDTASSDDNASRVRVEGWLTLDGGSALLAAAGLDYATLKLAASKRGFRPIDLGSTASVTLNNAIRRSSSANVIGVLPGSKRPAEYVLYMAHWDHLGKAMGRSLKGETDTIHNGAMDNATGTAGLLAIASAFQRANPAPERSIAFLAVTLEESGLLGSAYYGANPVLPLAKTVAAINMDGLPFRGPTRDVTVYGDGASELEAYAAAAAKRQDRVLRPDPTPERGSFYRSDHFNLAKRGVPALYLHLGIDDREHGAEWGQAQENEFIAKRYHQPGDEYRPGLDLRGGLEDLQLLYAVGARLARERTFPNWLPDSEFRAIRDRSLAAASATKH